MSEQIQTHKTECLFRWNIDNDAYRPSIAVYGNGLVEIVVGGRGLGRSIEGFFKDSLTVDVLTSQLEICKEALKKIDGLPITDVEHNDDWGKMKLIAKEALSQLKYREEKQGSK